MAAQRDREVVWSDSATRDLEEIITFVAEASHATAEHLLTNDLLLERLLRDPRA